MNRTWICWRDPKHSGVIITRFGWPQCRVCFAAPAYHDRGQWMSSERTVPVFVPTPESTLRATLAPASAVVGIAAGGFAEVTFEGWVHGANQYADRDARGKWEAGLLHAADRLITDYPTRARAVVPEADLIYVGDFNPTTHVVTVTDERTVTEWLEG